MKAILSAFLGLAAVCGTAQARIPAPPAETADIPVTYMVDLGSGQVMYSRDADRSFVPASMTKVMTAFVAFEEMAAGRLASDREITVRPETARLWNGRGTSMYLTAGERLTVDDLLRGIMTASANDASVVLAEGYLGSVAAWTFLMNDAAKRLGMTKSHFNTPNGWPDEGQTYVSARDLGALAQAMIRRYPDYYERYSGKNETVWKNVRLFSHDPVTGVVPGADGIKTGYTREAGYNFLGSAKRGNRRLVMVVAGARSEAQRTAASRAFMEWGFSAWRARPLFAAKAQIGTARVQGGTNKEVSLVARDPVYATIPVDDSEPIRLRIVYHGPRIAPIEKGEQVAQLEIRVGNMTPSRLPLFAATHVGKAGPIDRLRDGLMNLFS